MSASRAVSPELKFVNPPETKIRFRYLSEGGSHGGLTGKDKSRGKKSYPTVKLFNYRGKKRVYVRVSLFTEDEKEHVLEFKEKKTEKAVPHITEPINEDDTAVFPDLKILSKKKDEIEKLLMDRKIKNLREGITPAVRIQFEKKYSKEVKDRAKAILNSVKLKFEAFEEDRPNVPLCFVFSDIICNQKAASKGDLKIYRMSRIAGSWRGGDEVILLCDKVQKENIKVRFYEMDSRMKEVIWEGYGEFTRADVHFQVAITFKTPPYKENVEKTVYVCLERSINDSLEMSEAREFKYITEDIHISKKRKYNSSNNQSKEEVTMNHQEIAESSPMDVNFSDSSTNESPSRRENFSAYQNMNLFSPNSGESSENSSCPEFSNNALNMPEVPFDENAFSEFGVDSQELHTLLNDFEFPFSISTSDMRIFPDLCEFQEEIDTNDYGDPNRIYNQCLEPVEIDYPVGQMALISFDLSKCTVDEPKNKECVSTLKECELSRKEQHKIEKIRRHLSKRDSFNNTLLHVAVHVNKKIPNIIAMICAAKCDIINEQNHKKQTALHIATKQNNEEVVKILLKNGANPNLKDIDGNNCYHVAAYHHSYEALMCIFYIQSVPPDVNAFNYEGLTPLHISVMANSLNCFHLLRTHMADVSLVEKKCDKSLLHIAVEHQPSFVSILLEMEELDVNVQDSEGNTPLHMACASENISVVKLLLQAGADPSLRNFKQNYNILTESKDDIPDGKVQAEMSSNNENDENTSDGETPADMTSNSQIQEILKNAVEPVIANSPDLLPSSSELSDNDTLKKLCAYLDDEDRWKKISLYFVDEVYNGSLECSDSPTKALLTYIKKEQQDMENLKEVLRLAGLTKALDIIDEGHLLQ